MTVENHNHTRLLTIVVSITLFIASLTQNGFTVGDEQTSIGPGLALVGTGWLCTMICAAGISWLANPFLLISWLSFKSEANKLSFVSSIVAFIAALSFAIFRSIAVDEGGSLHEISGYLLGYWLWLTSCLIMLFGNLYLNFKRSKTLS